MDPEWEQTMQCYQTLPRRRTRKRYDMYSSNGGLSALPPSGRVSRSPQSSITSLNLKVGSRDEYIIFRMSH